MGSNPIGDANLRDFAGSSKQGSKQVLQYVRVLGDRRPDCPYCGDLEIEPCPDCRGKDWNVRLTGF